jgi:circadian clock protein KaiB
MRSKQTRYATRQFEGLLGKSSAPQYVLRLYITGATPQSVRALANIKRICEEHLSGSYRLDVIDLYQQPHLAKAAQIVAAPTLVRQTPLPMRRILGDMSKTERVLAGLGLQ